LRQEFGIELLLPALQRLLVDFAIVPIVIGRDDDSASVAVGEILSTVAKDESILLVGGVNLLEKENLSPDLRSRIVNSIRARDLNRATERITAAQISGASPLLSIMYATARAGINEVILPKSDGSEIDDYVSDLGTLSAVFMKH
jgi:AmmeMemoRadiSam system protein B